jgi:hypothetical protein
MTTEEARSTEVDITRTERGGYGNAHIRYDINDGLVDVILEVTPTGEQKELRGLENKKSKMANEEWRKRQNTKYGENTDQDTTKSHEMHARNTPSQRKRRKDGTRKV